MPGQAAPEAHKEFEFRSLSVFPLSNQPATEFRFEIARDSAWHDYRMLRSEEWATHSLRHEERKSGIRSVITKTETRGPYTRPFTVYFIHTKTAFSVKGVCKRFSAFKELDAKIKKAFKTFNSPFPPDKVFNSMQPEFVNERRKQLQRYLDDALSVPEIASFPELHAFLNIPEYNELVTEELEEEFQREQKRNSHPDGDKPETYLRAIDLAKAKGMTEVSPAMLEGFAAAKVLVEGLRRAGPKPSREKIQTALESIQKFDLGGLDISYGPDDHTGLDFADLSIIGTDGKFRR